MASELPREILLQLLGVFTAEAEEHLEHITKALLELEKNPPEEQRNTLIEEVFREAHSLKGSAGTLGLHEMEQVGHAMEDLFGAAKQGEVALDPALVDTLLQSLDFLRALLERVRDGSPTEPAEVEAFVARINAPMTLTKAEPAATSAAEPVTTKKPRAKTAEKIAQPPPEKETSASPTEEVQPDTKDEPKEEVKEESSRFEPQRMHAGQADRTIRVSMAKLDAFMHQAEEIVLAKIRVEQRLTDVHTLTEQVAGLLRDRERSREQQRRLRLIAVGGRTTIAASVNTDEATQEATKQVVDQLKQVYSRLTLINRALVNDAQQMQLLSTQVQDELKGLRLIPVGSVFEPFHRVVRDLAKKLGKRVDFHVNGADTEVDKRIVEEIKDPLVHLLRNSLDHGLESPEQRVAQGKTEVGKLTLSAEQRGNRMLVVISDDGRGVDPARVRQIAVAKNVITQNDAETMSEDEIRRLIFAPGFSTAETVSDISGRGVGLDVVKQNLSKLGGTVDLQSEMGKGTTFTLSVPVTLAAAQGLIVAIASETFALPINAIERIVRISPADVSNVRNRSMLRVDGRFVPLVSLADVLGIPHHGLRPDDQGMFSVVVVGAVEKRVAFVVDQLIEELEIVTKPLTKPLVRVRNVAGATILGDGRAVILLNPSDLVRTAHGESIRSPKIRDVDEQVTVLVADDTMTTRTLQKQLLEMAGFRVIAAQNGEEAWQILQGGEPIRVLVTDVQMPRLDGFDLTARVRGDGRLKNLPVILVTSLGSEADKARGIEVGADAYIVKKEYEKGKILELIRQLL